MREALADFPHGEIIHHHSSYYVGTSSELGQAHFKTSEKANQLDVYQEAHTRPAVYPTQTHVAPKHLQNSLKVVLHNGERTTIPSNKKADGEPRLFRE